MGIRSQFKLKVVDRASGKSSWKFFDASNADEAVRIAGLEGFAVEKVGEQSARMEHCPICEFVHNYDGSCCTNCGYPDLSAVSLWRERQAQERQATAERNARVTNTAIRCPKCHSEQVMGGTKGFGLGKAVAGGLLLGPVGLLGGLIGGKKVTVSCLRCGHRWTP